MVSFACEQWPDTVLPASDTNVDADISNVISFQVSEEHLWDAWAQISLELAKIHCQVFCTFKSNAYMKKTLFYGSKVMPLRIMDNVSRCEIRGLIQRDDDCLDIVCVARDKKFDCVSGLRARLSQIAGIEIRTAKGCLNLITFGRNVTPMSWIHLETANELSCWLWTVSNKENARNHNRIDIQSMLSDNMKKILK